MRAIRRSRRLKACGVQDTKIGEMIMMIITMIIAIVATAKGGGAGSLGKGVAGAAEKGADVAAKSVADAAKEAIQNFQKILAEAIEKLKNLPADIAKGIKDGLTEALEGLKSIGKGVADLKAVLSEISKAKDAIKAAAGDAAEIAKQTENLAKLKDALPVAARNAAESASKTLKITSAVIQTGEGIARGVIGIQIYKLKLQIGDLQEAEALLQAIIDLLQKLLDNIDLGIQGSSDLLASANNFLNKFTAGWEESDKKIFGSRSM